MLQQWLNKSIQVLTDKTTYVRIGRYLRQLLDRALAYKDRIEKNIPNWNTREKAHPAILRFGIVILIIGLTILFKAFVNSFIAYQLPFMIFYSAIVLSAWYGGIRPGILAIFVSAFCAYFLYYTNVNFFDPFSVAVSIVLFCLEGFLIVGISHSMHNALQTLEEKKQQSQYFASIAQNISDAVISTDMNFVIQSWNKGAEQLYGWKRNEVIGAPLYEVISRTNNTQAKQELRDLLMYEGFWRGEVQHMRKNNSPVYVLTSMSILKDENNKPLGVVAVNRDITDRKKLEQGKDDFIALASHELKTPLTSIKLYADVLKQRFEHNDDRKSLTYLTKINGQVHKLFELVNHLLDVSKVQSGKLHYALEEVSIDMFVSQVVRDIQEVTPTHRLLIQERINATVKIDTDRMRQVLVNILTNAVKYSAKTDRIFVFMKRTNSHVQISIQDFGIGIPREKHDKIFERFYQVTDSKGYTYSGMGLGLYISHEIIEKHSGKLWVESEEGKGSTFHFTLPIVKSYG